MEFILLFSVLSFLLHSQDYFLVWFHRILQHLQQKALSCLGILIYHLGSLCNLECHHLVLVLSAEEVYLILVQSEITLPELLLVQVMISFIICKCSKLHSTGFHNPRTPSVLKLTFRYGFLKDMGTCYKVSRALFLLSYPLIFSGTLQLPLLVTPKFRHQLYHILPFGKELVVTH